MALCDQQPCTAAQEERECRNYLERLCGRRLSLIELGLAGTIVLLLVGWGIVEHVTAPPAPAAAVSGMPSAPRIPAACNEAAGYFAEEC